MTADAWQSADIHLVALDVPGGMGAQFDAAMPEGCW